MSKTYKNLTAILYVGEQFTNLSQKIETLSSSIKRLLVIAPHNISIPTYSNVSTILYDQESNKAEMLNLGISIADTEWIMLLEGDEEFLMKHLEHIPFEENEAYAFLIESYDAESKTTKNHYQTRIFNKIEFRNTFEGLNIPDISTAFKNEGWQLSETIIPVRKATELYPDAIIEAEVESDCKTKQARFWEATLESSKGNYLKAETILKRLIKEEDPITFNHVASLNGLADALMEQHKWEDAELTALRSLDYAKVQRAPYLILFKVNYVNGRWEKAYTALDGYLTTLDYASRATMDVILPINECHFLMGESAHRMSDYEKAFKHYEQFYILNKGNVASTVIERLFIYSIELNDFDKSVGFFNEMFGEYLEEQKLDDVPVKMFESLTLFNKKGWFDFVSHVYEQLRSYDPTNKKLLHGWVATLVKANKLEQAQELIGFMNKKKKPA